MFLFPQLLVSFVRESPPHMRSSDINLNPKNDQYKGFK